jgi:hypothetical protein
MASKVPHPSYARIAEVFLHELKLYGPSVWQKFLDECGLEHISMSRLEIVNVEKYILAKIKYGF